MGLRRRGIRPCREARPGGGTWFRCEARAGRGTRPGCEARAAEPAPGVKLPPRIRSGGAVRPGRGIRFRCAGRAGCGTRSGYAAWAGRGIRSGGAVRPGRGTRSGRAVRAGHGTGHRCRAGHGHRAGPGRGAWRDHADGPRRDRRHARAVLPQPAAGELAPVGRAGRREFRDRQRGRGLVHPATGPAGGRGQPAAALLPRAHRRQGPDREGQHDHLGGRGNRADPGECRTMAVRGGDRVRDRRLGARPAAVRL